MASTTVGRLTSGRLTSSGVVSDPLRGIQAYHGKDALVVFQDDKILVQDSLTQLKMEIDLTTRDPQAPDFWAGKGFVLRDGTTHLQAVTFAAQDNGDGTYRVDSEEAMWFWCTISRP